MSNDVVAVLFGFLQAIGFAQAPVAAPPDFEAAITRLSHHRTLRAETVLTWPATDRLALTELLKAWLIVLQTAQITGAAVTFPQTFLEGCSSSRLGPKIVAEILARSAQLRGIDPSKPKVPQDRRT